MQQWIQNGRNKMCSNWLMPMSMPKKETIWSLNPNTMRRASDSFLNVSGGYTKHIEETFQTLPRTLQVFFAFLAASWKLRIPKNTDDFMLGIQDWGRHTFTIRSPSFTYISLKPTRNSHVIREKFRPKGASPKNKAFKSSPPCPPCRHCSRPTTGHSKYIAASMRSWRGPSLPAHECHEYTEIPIDLKNNHHLNHIWVTNTGIVGVSQNGISEFICAPC